jgi:hypothetical protein
MRCVSSRFFTAAPRFSAGIDQLAREALNGMDFSPRLRAASMSQRMASACGATGALRPAPGRWRRRRGATSPRPRRDVVERLLDRRRGRRRLLALLDAVERAVDDRSATDFLPLDMTMFMNLASVL